MPLKLLTHGLGMRVCVGGAPDLIGHLLLITALEAADDQEPEEEEKEQEEQQCPDHRPRYDSRLVGRWQ